MEGQGSRLEGINNTPGELGQATGKDRRSEYLVYSTPLGSYRDRCKTLI